MALAGLGHCLGRMGHRREARDRLLQAVRLLLRERKHSGGGLGECGPLLDLAIELHGIGAYRESLDPIGQVLKREPASARAHHLQALTLTRLNDNVAARRSASRALGLAPGESNAAILLATLEARCGDLDTARMRLEALVENGSDPNRARAIFELGLVLDRLGEYDRAFDRLADSGRMMLHSPQAAHFDPEAIYRSLEQEREQVTQAGIDAVDTASREDDMADPVFLIGFYRSGTTLLEQVLNAHPAVTTSDEAALLPQVLRELYRRSPGSGLHWLPRLQALGPKALAQLRRYYWEQARMRLGEGLRDRILVDKTALNTLHVGFIHALFPRARFLFALRDPRDVRLSSFMQALVPNALTLHLVDWEEGARFYASVMHHWLVMRKRLNLDWTEIRYEDVVTDLRAAVLPALTLLGIEWIPEMGRFHEHARERVIATPSFTDVTRPIYRSAIGRWRNYASRFEVLAPHLRPFALELGYDWPNQF